MPYTIYELYSFSLQTHLLLNTRIAHLNCLTLTLAPNLTLTLTPIFTLADPLLGQFPNPNRKKN